jgi:hypothetical protein
MNAVRFVGWVDVLFGLAAWVVSLAAGLIACGGGWQLGRGLFTLRRWRELQEQRHRIAQVRAHEGRLFGMLRRAFDTGWFGGWKAAHDVKRDLDVGPLVATRDLPVTRDRAWRQFVATITQRDRQS